MVATDDRMVADGGGPLAATAQSAELAAVLAALAGVRKGEAVAAVGCGPLIERVLVAGAGRPLLQPPAAEPFGAPAAPSPPGGPPDERAKVVVAGTALDVPAALCLLAPGGRLVAVAADPGAAARVAVRAGLELRHVERMTSGVAWAATRPLAP